MYALASHILNLPIISLQTGLQVAATSKPIINPDKLELVAFYCSGNNWRENKKVLLVQDIRQTTREGMVIDSINEIYDPSEIVRLKHLLEPPFLLNGLPVFNESGVKLGRVEEYTVNVQSFQIQKIYLKQSVIKNLMLTNLVVDRSQIIEVNHSQIVVRDATITKPILNPRPVAPPSL